MTGKSNDNDDYDDDDDDDDELQWRNTDSTQPRYFNWRHCRRRRLDHCNSLPPRGRLGRGGCVAVSGARQMVVRSCEVGRRRAVCARPAGAPASARRRRRQHSMLTTR